jgi:hypothetical protein
VVFKPKIWLGFVLKVFDFISRAKFLFKNQPSLKKKKELPVIY